MGGDDKERLGRGGERCHNQDRNLSPAEFTAVGERRVGWLGLGLVAVPSSALRDDRAGGQFFLSIMCQTQSGGGGGGGIFLLLPDWKEGELRKRNGIKSATRNNVSCIQLRVTRVRRRPERGRKKLLSLNKLLANFFSQI